MPHTNSVASSDAGQGMDTLDAMMRGFPSIDDYLREQRLSLRQRWKLRAYRAAIAARRTWLRATGGMTRISEAVAAEEQRRVGLRLRTRPLRAAHAGGHYLGADEVARFERDGLLGPFPVLTPDEARALAADVRASTEDFKDNHYYGQEFADIQRRQGFWNLDWIALYQALRHQGLWDLTTHPAIVQRMASLLGDDVMCWRNQVFEKAPGDAGTIWHQNSVFQENSRAHKLAPTTAVDPGMVQLTAWVALSDVTIENGALRVVVGSFVDGRLEHAYEFARNRTQDFMATLDPDQVDRFLRVALFAPTNFMKAQAMFELNAPRFAAMLGRCEVRDLTMRAGEAIIFSSLNMHGSFANTSAADTRLAFAGRYANHDVRAYPGQTFDVFPTATGEVRFPVAPLACIHVHGEDRFGHNHVVRRCNDPSARPRRAR